MPFGNARQCSDSVHFMSDAESDADDPNGLPYTVNIIACRRSAGLCQPSFVATSVTLSVVYTCQFMQLITAAGNGSHRSRAYRYLGNQWGADQGAAGSGCSMSSSGVSSPPQPSETAIRLAQELLSALGTSTLRPWLVEERC